MRSVLLSTRARRVVIGGMGVAFTGLVLILIWAIVTSAVKSSEVRATQEDRLPQVEQNDRTFVLLTDCVQPGGQCYRRSQRQTAKAVGDIGATNILTVVCALDVPDGTPLDAAVKQVSRCVADGLRERSDR